MVTIFVGGAGDLTCWLSKSEVESAYHLYEEAPFGLTERGSLHFGADAFRLSPVPWRAAASL